MPDAIDVLIQAAHDSGDPLALRLAFHLSEAVALADRLASGEELQRVYLELTAASGRMFEAREAATAAEDRARGAESRERMFANRNMQLEAERDYWRNQATRGAVDAMLADDPEDAAYFAQAVTP